MFEVQKGIKPPAANGLKLPKYPFKTMEVGDSFFVPFGDDPPSRVRSRLSSSANVASARFGRKFSQHIVKEDGVEGYRLWRTA